MQEIEKALINELEGVLEVYAPSETKLAGHYVMNPDLLPEREMQKIAGVFAGELVALVGPIILHWLVVIVREIIAETRKEAVGTAAKAIVKWLANRFGPKDKSEVGSSHERTVLAVTEALIKAGWDAGKAGEAAEDVWKRGLKLAAKAIAA